MTDQASLAYEPAKTESGARRGGLVATAVAVGLVTLLAVGAGAATAFLIATPTPEAEADAGADAVAQTPAVYAASGAVILVPMEPVITNIAQPATAVVRIEASLVLRADAADPEVIAARVGADTLAFARSLELAQIEGARGLSHLREDLRERAQLRSPAVVDIVLSSLVAQ